MKTALIIILVAASIPVLLIGMAIFPAICPAEWAKAKNGGF